MINGNRLTSRGDSDRHLRDWSGYGDGRACGDVRIGDGGGCERDGRRIGNIRWRGVGDGRAGRARCSGESAARSASTAGTGKAPAHAFVLRIILNGGGEILRLIDCECLGLRRNAHADGGCGSGDGDGRQGGLGSIRDGGCGENDGRRGGHLGWGGGCDGGRSRAGSGGHHSACAWIAMGKSPRHALAPWVIGNGGAETLRLAQLESCGGRRGGYGNGRLGRRRNGGRGIAAWRGGVRARV